MFKKFIMPANRNIIERLNKIGIIRLNREQIVYKYMPVETALLILANKTLMFQSPSNLNDPFELHMALMDFNFNEDQAIAIYEKYFNKGEAVTGDLRSNLEKNGKELIVESTKKVFEDFRSNVGITCFTKVPSNTLMWSHYGDSHRGVCLGFLLPGINRSRDTFNVNYVRTIFPLRFYDDEENDLLFWHWMFTKSKVWSYEEEVRCVNMLSNGIQPFDDITVSEVYYGAGIKQEDTIKIERLLAMHNITKKVRMVIDVSTFDLIEEAMR